MKKIVLISALPLVMAATVHAQSEKSVVKTDMTKLQGQETTVRKEMKEERKELKRLEGKAVSMNSKQAFAQDFGSPANVSWRRSAFFDEATFTNELGEKRTAYYDYDSQLVGTTMYKSFSDIPANAQRFITEKYPGYSIGEVVFFDDNEANETDMIYYGTQFDDEDNYFVPLTKDNQTTIVRVNLSGDVSFFKKL